MKTTSLELSKQLKEAGFPQNTNYYWVYSISDGKDCKVDWKSVGAYKPSYAAPTTDEILEQLPGVVRYKDADYHIAIGLLGGTKAVGYEKLWFVGYRQIISRETENPVYGLFLDINTRIAHASGADNMAEPAGRIYRYLAENHLLKEDNNEAQTKEGATS